MGAQQTCLAECLTVCNCYVDLMANSNYKSAHKLNYLNFKIIKMKFNYSSSNFGYVCGEDMAFLKITAILHLQGSSLWFFSSVMSVNF